MNNYVNPYICIWECQKSVCAQITNLSAQVQVWFSNDFFPSWNLPRKNECFALLP